MFFLISSLCHVYIVLLALCMYTKNPTKARDDEFYLSRHVYDALHIFAQESTCYKSCAITA